MRFAIRYKGSVTATENPAIRQVGRLICQRGGPRGRLVSAKVKKVLKADELVTHIRQLILEGQYEPGQELTEELLAHDLPAKAKYTDSFSAHPLRQALIELEKEGFVEIKPQAWTKVRYVNAKELRAIWDNRAALEEFIACQIARRRGLDLTGPVKTNEEMAQLAATAGPKPTEDAQRRFVELDVEFHGKLARSAGYEFLADQLANLRMRLHQKAFPSLFSDTVRMNDVVREHGTLLAAIQPGPGGSRPDINTVRLEVRNHLRNSAKRWRIEQQLRYQPDDYVRDFVFDLPDVFLPQSGGNTAVPVQHVLATRLTLELSSVVELAARKDRDLSSVAQLNNEMAALAVRCGREGYVVTQADRTEFVNLDIGFHATLGFLSGLLFAEEGIIHAWGVMFKLWKRKLDANRMTKVVGEHTAILDALAASHGGDNRAVAQSVRMHMMNAIKRSPPDDSRFDVKQFARAAKLMAEWVASPVPPVTDDQQAGITTAARAEKSEAAGKVRKRK